MGESLSDLAELAFFQRIKVRSCFTERGHARKRDAHRVIKPFGVRKRAFLPGIWQARATDVSGGVKMVQNRRFENPVGVQPSKTKKPARKVAGMGFW
jgi:hypothetical protein